MVVKLDFTEGLKDTPLFRKNLTRAENDIESFETIYKKINDNCQLFYNDGQRYLESFKRMIDSFEYLKLVLSDYEEQFSQNKVKNFCSLLKEARQSEEACLNDAHRTVSEKVSSFCESDLKRIKESRKQFERSSADLDSSYQKNSDASKLKPAHCEEAEKNLTVCKKTFEQDGIEYIQNVNQFYNLRTNSILGNVISIDINGYPTDSS